MDSIRALEALTALGHGTRLEAFRLLVRAGPEGLCAGAVAEALNARQNTMSANLAVLNRAGLIASQREGRSIRYHAELDTMRGLLGFLMEDCCNGRAEKCQPLLDEIVRGLP